MDALDKRGIGTISMSVVEGLRNVDEAILDSFLHFSKDAVEKMTEGRSEAHIAVKLTSFISMEIMEKISKAQNHLVHQIIGLDYKDANSVLTKEELVSNLKKAGISSWTETDL